MRYRVLPGGRRTLDRPAILVERVPEIEGDVSADAILAVVGNDPQLARDYLELERKGKRRKGLTAKLEALANG